MAPPIRATLDPVTIAAWAAILAEYRRGRGQAHAVLGLVSVVSAVAAIASSRHGVASIALVCLVLAGMLDRHAQRDIRCPHCGDVPWFPGKQVSVVSLQWCESCYYWLRKPY